MNARAYVTPCMHGTWAGDKLAHVGSAWLVLELWQVSVKTIASTLTK